jgi:hypothetical protein
MNREKAGMPMATGQTLLAVMLVRRGLNRYGSFTAAYQKAERSLDPMTGSGRRAAPSFTAGSPAA